MLCFEEVLADDPEVSGPEYVNVLPGTLPDLQGGDFWRPLVVADPLQLVFECPVV